MVESKRIIRKVWKANNNQTLHITIPKGMGIKDGDYVELELVK